MVGDGFGGRLWYNPTNYTVGSYSGYSICYDICGGGETQLYGWGNNGSNQLGLGTSIPGVDIPTLIPNTNNVKYYSTGYIMGAIKNDETGWAWGGGITGSPIEVITDVKFLDASSTTISFIKTDGTVWSIGGNSLGNFGDGTTVSSSTIPIKMLSITNAVRVANNSGATIILLDNGTLMGVGSNTSGYLGLGSSFAGTLTPLPIPGLPFIVDIKSYNSGTIALTSSGQVYQWGYNYGSGGYIYSPTLIPSLSNIVAISGCDDGGHYLALDEYKNCYAWGYNGFGNCGLSYTTYPTIPLPMLVATNVIDIMAGETFSYLVKADGTLWATGLSNYGSIWLNLTDIQRDSFTQLDPSALPGACELVGITANTTTCVDSNPGTITISNYGGTAPFTYSIGGAFQSSNVFTNVGAGTFMVTVNDVNGCSYNTTVTVEGINCTVPPIGNINFPNIFSPNQDTENPNFYFPNEGLTQINCKIFDRWGVQIYEWNDVNGFWNGKNSNDKECIEGVYYYTVSYSLFDSPIKNKSGFVTLVK